MKIKTVVKKRKSYPLHERLHFYRKRYGLTQQEVAKRAGITQSALAYFESGKISPTVSTLVALAEAMDVSPAVFFNEDDVLIFDLKTWNKRGYKKLEDLPDYLHRNLVTVYLLAKKMGMG